MRGTAVAGALTRVVLAAGVVVATACRPVGPPTPATPPSTVDPGADRAGAPPPAQAPGVVCPADRRQTALDAVNLLRTDRGLRALRPEPRLEAAAQAHAADLVRHGIRGHEGSDGSLPADRATDAGYPWILVGENVARGYATPSTVVSGWMASPPHRENLLNPDYREAGVAWAEGSTQPNPVWVLVLGRRRAAPEGPPGCVGEGAASAQDDSGGR